MKLVTERDVLAAYLEGAKTPLDKVRASVHWAQQTLKLLIAHGDYGVIPTSDEWVIDDKRRPRRHVSPLGAVVLAYQPDPATDMPDPAATALGVPFQWAEGFQDGFDRNLSGTWLGSVSRRLYMEGVEAGMQIRFELTKVCDRCSTRHFREEPCPLCEERGQTVEMFT